MRVVLIVVIVALVTSVTLVVGYRPSSARSTPS